ncbi:aspartate/glutamate racemase family protein [Saccharopolyspora sp. NPDC047091]|uniref:aspartate/glutamate racemase family protein n=1 Tax=Saccharopolyspora sp. NPDC047091 TaxID=3155924 RepID=UPI0033D1B792
MRIVVANVNTTEAVTEVIRAQATAIAAPGTEILAVTPRFGPPSVEGNFESYLAAVAVMDRVRAVPDPFDAVVLAGFGEHGKEGLAELFDVPVVDITEAAAHTASLLGRRFSVVTSLARTTGQIADRLALTGLSSRCASVRATGMAVLELEADPERARDRLAAEAVRAVREDGAEVICLGCAGMAGLAEQVRDAAGVPVVDGVPAAVGLAELLVRQRLSTSKVGGWASPLPKEITGWPISRA